MHREHSAGSIGRGWCYRYSCVPFCTEFDTNIHGETQGNPRGYDPPQTSAYSRVVNPRVVWSAPYRTYKMEKSDEQGGFQTGHSIINILEGISRFGCLYISSSEEHLGRQSGLNILIVARGACSPLSKGKIMQMQPLI